MNYLIAWLKKIKLIHQAYLSSNQRMNWRQSMICRSCTQSDNLEQEFRYPCLYLRRLGREKGHGEGAWFSYLKWSCRCIFSGLSIQHINWHLYWLDCLSSRMIGYVTKPDQKNTTQASHCTVEPRFAFSLRSKIDSDSKLCVISGEKQPEKH
jgi:hypothetical protein